MSDALIKVDLEHFSITFLSHYNPCFPCNIAIMNFLVLRTYEIRFHDIIDCTVYYVYVMTSSFAKIPKHGQMCMFWTLIFQFNLLDLVM